MAVKSAYSTVKVFLYLVVLVLVVGSTLFVFHSQHSKLFAEATTHQPEKFTELYFTNPNNLPSLVKSGQKLPLNFSVHNIEGTNMTYDYQVSVIYATGKPVIFNEQELYLANGNTANVIYNIKIPVRKGKIEVDIQLVNQPDAIHMWMEVTS